MSKLFGVPFNTNYFRMIADFWPISALCLLEQKQIRWAEFVPQTMKPIMNINEKDTSLTSCFKILRALHTVKLSLRTQ